MPFIRYKYSTSGGAGITYTVDYLEQTTRSNMDSSVSGYLKTNN